MMLSYYLELAIRSLRRNVALTALMVTVVGFGIGASMTVLTTLRAMAVDPIPNKSAQLFVPQIDAWGPPTRPGGGADGSGQLFDQLTYRDATGLMQARKAARQTAMYAVSLDTVSLEGVPLPVDGRAAYADFFQMFEVPFRYGGPWSAADDKGRANVVVLSARLAARLFPHVNPVGRTISLSGQEYRIVGVMDVWNPVPRFYDLTQGPNSGLADADSLFVPFSTAIEREMPDNGSIRCNARVAPGFAGQLASECVWIQFWAQLPTQAAARDYKTFLYNYAAEQRRLGRFHWKPWVELRDVHQWMALEISVPETLRVSSVVAFGFLAVCLINAAGLMLARFSGRAGELGVRRALGASRWDIGWQCVVETAVVGLPAGVVGLALTFAGLASQRALHMVAGSAAAVARVTSLGDGMIAITLVLAVCATVCSALYPIWRASRLLPAWQLKAQ
ncbi:MAG TPA: ABC transporter permease [Steroidobacteraceae bacterium]|nr:ABC transporter permease [Steroidobacteraceae bacterium]